MGKKPDAKPFDTNNIPGFTDASGTAANPADAPALTPPSVPGKSGGPSGSTTVSTPSMKVFADNVSTLLTPLNKALELVQNMKPVKAGDFNTGHVMATSITGSSGDGMLQAGFETVLKKCIKTVTDTHEAVSKLAKDYENIDDLNKLTGQQLTRSMGDVPTDIPAIGQAGSTVGGGSRPSSS
jgi:hypothetical protein